MIKNYLTVAVRNLVRNKGYTLINVASLAIGMACVILIGLYVRHEFSYDAWHTKGDRIYRIVRETKSSDGSVAISVNTMGLLAEALKEDFPEIEATNRRMSWGGIWVFRGETGFYQRFGWTDSNFFEVFDFPLLAGDPKTVLERSHTIVLTESMAAKYFGSEDPIGKRISVDDRYL